MFSMRKRVLVLFVCFGFLALGSLAGKDVVGSEQAGGVGGGGWLHAGAYHPTNPDVLVLGADVSGVYRSEDNGLNWFPWNDGLPNPEEGCSHYVEDFCALSMGGFTGFYAATYGGIYRRADAGAAWELTTPVPYYTYDVTDTSYGWHAQPIPFACLDDNGDNTLLVAGAGRVRWNKPYETTYYPGLPKGVFEPYPGSLATEQWTVWTLDLTNPKAQWMADKSTFFGAARDITACKLNNVTYIAVATPQGIYLHDGKQWKDIGLSMYGQNLSCWSLHLTCRGTLYAAMDRLEGGTLPSGVWRLPYVGSSKSKWEWVGDDTTMHPNFDKTMWETGLLDNVDLIYLSVVDGAAGTFDPDILYLGERKTSGGYGGLYRCSANYLQAGNTCTWEHKVYSEWISGQRYFRYIDGNGQVQSLDPGWADMWGLHTLFHPVISPVMPNRIAIQFSVMLHVSLDGGDSWIQRYTMDQGGTWKSRGYNELCSRGLDFMPNGRVVQSNGDCGTFISTDTDVSLDSFQWVHPEVSGAAVYTDDQAWTHETAHVRVRSNWMGGGEAMLFVNCGDYIQKKAPAKLFMYDEPGQWTNITKTYDTERMILGDFDFDGDDTIYISYIEYDQRVQAGAKMKEFGVLKGIYSTQFDLWSWSKLNKGLKYTDPGSGLEWNVFGEAILTHAPSGRVYLAANTKVVSPSNAVIPERISVKGGLFVLKSGKWILEYGGPGTHWMDFRCLALSATGNKMYAGTRGRSMAGWGGVLKCANPGSDPSTWTPIANDTTFPFDFQTPFWSTWSYELTNRTLTDVRAIAVYPNDPNVILVGMSCDGFMEKEGLWIYNLNGSKAWQHLSGGRLFTGMGVYPIAFSNKYPKRFVFGTTGQELYTMKIKIVVEDPPDPHQDP